MNLVMVSSFGAGPGGRAKPRSSGIRPACAKLAAGTIALRASYSSMRCSSCGSENRESRKFCAECGATLTLACAACGASNQPGERFCGECGKPLASAAKESTPSDPRAYTPKHLAERILTSRSALEGERKQVTILFADVKGSMDLAEQLDPEEWHKVLDGFFQ